MSRAIAATWRERVPERNADEGMWQHADRIWRVRLCSACPHCVARGCVPQNIPLQHPERPTNCCLH